MEAVDICPLTKEAIENLIASRGACTSANVKPCRRRTERWAFPGTVELWLPDGNGRECYALATSINLSTRGIGIRADEALTPGVQLGIAVHEPEASFHGRAVVRHCTDTGQGYHIVGLEFLFG
ncbi:MAG: PilZ domain-containing protein [Planctomycetota bacterium]